MNIQWEKKTMEEVRQCKEQGHSPLLQIEKGGHSLLLSLEEAEEVMKQFKNMKQELRTYETHLHENRNLNENAQEVLMHMVSLYNVKPFATLYWDSSIDELEEIMRELFTKDGIRDLPFELKENELFIPSLDIIIPFRREERWDSEGETYYRYFFHSPLTTKEKIQHLVQTYHVSQQRPFADEVERIEVKELIEKLFKQHELEHVTFHLHEINEQRTKIIIHNLDYPFEVYIEKYVDMRRMQNIQHYEYYLKETNEEK